MTSDGSGNVRSIERACDILSCIFDGVDSLTEIGKELNLNKSTVHRILATLENKRLVYRNINNRFEIGPEFVKMVVKKLESNKTLIEAARPSMKRLNILTQETIVLHIAKGLERMCIFEIVSSHSLRYTAGIGECVPLYSGAASFVLLAFLDDESLEMALNKLDMKPLTSKTVLSVEDISKRLRQVRENGYDLSFGERLEGTACLSVPVFSSTGVVAALSILGPFERLQRNVITNYIPEFKKEAKIISKKLDELS